MARRALVQGHLQRPVDGSERLWPVVPVDRIDQLPLDDGLRRLRGGRAKLTDRSRLQPAKSGSVLEPRVISCT